MNSQQPQLEDVGIISIAIAALNVIQGAIIKTKGTGIELIITTTIWFILSIILSYTTIYILHEYLNVPFTEEIKWTSVST